jgi:hypothetical protein
VLIVLIFTGLMIKIINCKSPVNRKIKNNVTISSDKDNTIIWMSLSLMVIWRILLPANI